jgi:hypothetical protein
VITHRNLDAIAKPVKSLFADLIKYLEKAQLASGK